MLKKTITYTDYNGESRTEDFYFNMTKAEIVEMEMSVNGGMSEFMKKVASTQDAPTLMSLFKDLVLRAYGEKSLDGKRFNKEDENGRKLADDFKQTEAYSELFMELAFNAEKAAEFVNGIIPQDVAKQLEESGALKK